MSGALVFPAGAALLLTVFAVGVGLGSVVCSRLLGGEVTARHVPFAAVGISLFAWDFAGLAAAAPTGAWTTAGGVLTDPSGLRMLADLALLSACGGVYSVPLYAVIQERSAPSCRSRMVACNNVVNAAFMVVGAGAAGALAAAGASVPDVLRLTAALNLVAALVIASCMPKEIVRTLLRGFFRATMRARIEGLENAATGRKTVIIANHQSFVDALLIAAFLPGDLVFAIDTEQAKRFAFLRRVVDLFPVDPTNPMTTKSMIKAVRDGRTLVIFPEGRITVTGDLMKIYDGPGTIADRADAVLLTVRIDGLIFHRFSRMHGKLPLRWFPRVSLSVLPARCVEVSEEKRGRARRETIGRMVEGLMTEAALLGRRTNRSLFAALLDSKAKYDLSRPIVADAQRNEADYGRLVLGAVVLGGKLAEISEPGERVGIMLPNLVGTVVSFFALQAYARVPAMMNFSTGADSMLSACAAAGIRTIVSSRLFVEKGKLDKLVEAVGASVRFVWLEDLRARIGPTDKLAGKLASLAPRLLPGTSVDPDAPAVVLFTSGSEGTPKGVVLSHRNILSNCAQVAATVDFDPTDQVFNALPMFHSFGLTGGTLLPLLHGVRTFLYPSPLHYKIVPELVYQERSTILFATDTFLTGYARKGHPRDFQSVRYVFAGAERVRPETRATYWTHFKKPIFEGYGATECSPVIALNTYAHFREGAVGRFLPGIEHRLEPVPGIEEGGRLFVRGPNVMLGYLQASAPGVLDRVQDGWYDTGDIVSVDDDGFVFIRGRAKRFAKIAGEMVSMTSAEALACAVWPDAAHAVVNLPDPRKGEQLVLVTTCTDASARDLLAAARERGVAEILVPRVVHAVDRLPLLGTGKTDYPAVHRLAEAAVLGQAA